MFLLFKKVYVKPQYLLDLDDNRGIVSPDLTSLIGDEMAAKYRDLGEQWFNVDNYAELVGESGVYDSDDAMFLDLVGKEKGTIYVDSLTYNTLFVKYIKAMYPEMSKETAWKVYNSFATQSKLMPYYGMHWGTDRDGVDNQVSLATAFEYATREIFGGVWNTTSVTVENSTLGQMRANAPVEFLIANKLNGNNTYDSILGTKIKALIGKKINAEATYLKGHLLGNLHRDWVQTLLGITYNQEDDLFALRGTNAKVDWLLDSTFNPGGVDWVATHPNVDYKNIRALSLAAATDTGVQAETEALSDDIIDIVLGATVSGANIDTILTAELTNSRSVFEVEDNIKVNVLFLGYIYKLKRSNSAELSSYSIG